MMKKHLIMLTAVLGVCLALSACTDKKKDDKKAPESTNISRPADTSEKKEVTEEKEPQQPQTPTVEEKPAEKTAEPENPPAPNPPQSANNVSLADVRSKIMSACSASDPLMLETSALSDLYGIQPSTVKQSAGFVTMSGTFPHEVIMVEAVNSDCASQIASLLQRRLGEVLEQSKSYDAQNYALAQKCSVMRNGNYVALFLSPDSEKMAEIYNGSVGR